MRRPNINFRVVTLALLILLGATAATARAQLSLLPPEAWPNDPVTISFAPDFVEIGRYRNELHQHLNDQLSFPDWQIEILRAFNMWARHSGLKIAIAPDSQRAFGVPGLAQSDPRFGDIRLGAFPQTNVLGNAVPFNFEAGTWAGDIFIDTSRDFYLHDWSSDEVPANQFDLFSVLLHEAGNSFGLVDEIVNTDSVMFFSYAGPRMELSPWDIAEVQALYGTPPADPFETEGMDDSFQSAREIEFSPQFPETLVETVSGQIHSGEDVDVYRFEGVRQAENCWLKLRARGKSLLCGRVTAYDAEFSEIATIAAEDPIFNTVGKEITNIGPGETIYVVVEWSGVPGFEFGDYELTLDFNENGGDELEAFDDDDDDDDENRFLEADDEALVDWIYDTQGLVDLETAANNSFAQAVTLVSPPGMPSGTRFELVSALATSTDRDVFRLKSAVDSTGTLSVNLHPLGLEPARLNMVVFDENRNRLPAQRHFRSTGDVAIEVEGIQPGATYFIRVLSRPGNVLAGNYLLTADVTTASSPLFPIEFINLDASNPDQFAAFTTYKTQLFQFELSMTSPDASNQACQLTIYNDTGRVELVTSVRSRRTRDAFVWLQAGTHYVRFTAQSRNGRTIVNSSVEFLGAAVSDDEGPVIIDPSGNPVSDAQEPSNDPAPSPDWEFPFLAILELLIPPEFPW